ncbi:MAG: hypothetical protein K9M10_02145 [Candidatus Pacebacteria bacterium]|nr:hypothetical protein [Candidatus Paceibacterota bacterium]MCF7857265.1 hypothetical protein [Candidatus Paceibacterota bacterium]
MFGFEQGKSNESVEIEKRMRVFFIRHSKATYASYAEAFASENPEADMNLEEQVPDLPPAGVELAQREAEKFFETFSADEDVVYAVSSTQMRALETAKIYVDIAKARGIEVVLHEKTGMELATKVGEGYVRTLDTLSLGSKNQLILSAFNSPAYLPKVNWEKVGNETRRMFEKIKEIVSKDDKGSWGANFDAHAEEAKKIDPSIVTSEELYETQFKNMKRLAEFAREKASGDKRVNILAFGHENYMSVALEKDTGDHSIKNVEAVEMQEDGTLRRVI